MNWLGTNNAGRNKMTSYKEVSFLGLAPKKKKKGREKEKEVNWMSPSTKRFPASGKKHFPLEPTVKPLPKTKRVSFLVSTPSKKPTAQYFGLANRSNNKKTVNQKATFMKPIKIINKPYYTQKRTPFKSSEMTLYGRNNLKKYGDRDMDGSPNMFDCSPGNVSKDGFFSNLLHKATGGNFGQSNEEYAAEKQDKATQKLVEERLANPYTPVVTTYDEDTGEMRQTDRVSNKELTKAQKNLDKAIRGAKMTDYEQKYGYKPEEYNFTNPDGTTTKKVRYVRIPDNQKDKEYKRTPLEPGVLKRAAEALGVGMSPEEQTDLIKEAETRRGIKSAAIKGEETYLEKRRQILKEKYIPHILSGETYNAATKKYEASGILPALSSLGSTMKSGMVSENWGNITNPATMTSTGEWKPAVKTAGYKARETPAAVLAAALPAGALGQNVQSIAKQAAAYPGIKSTKKKGTTSSSGNKGGRPRGSFKANQYIPGVGLVDVYTWRKYQSRQKAVTRMGGPQAQQYAQTQTQTQSPAQYAPTKVYDVGNYDRNKYQAPEIYDPNNLPPDQAADVENTAARYQRANWNMRYQQMKAKMNNVQQAQFDEQLSDNTLNAPNFMKGELTNVGGQNSLTYTNPENNILNAPNVNLGQMRNVTSATERPSITLSERPITNPRGDQYTETDLVSGKTVLKSRKSEKWMDGRAY